MVHHLLWQLCWRPRSYRNFRPAVPDNWGRGCITSGTIRWGFFGDAHHEEHVELCLHFDECEVVFLIWYPEFQRSIIILPINTAVLGSPPWQIHRTWFSLQHGRWPRFGVRWFRWSKKEQMARLGPKMASPWHHRSMVQGVFHVTFRKG